MAAKRIRLNHKIVVRLHLLAESCTICSSRSKGQSGNFWIHPVCVCVCVCVCVYICTYVRTYVCMYVCMYVWLHTAQRFRRSRRCHGGLTILSFMGKWHYIPTKANGYVATNGNTDDKIVTLHTYTLIPSGVRQQRLQRSQTFIARSAYQQTHELRFGIVYFTLLYG
jgi:hypothetical protein